MLLRVWNLFQCKLGFQKIYISAFASATFFRYEMLLLLFSLMGVALYLAVEYYRAKMRPFVEKAEKIPGPRTLPLIGNALDFGTSTKRTSIIYHAFLPE
jgi:hypothetical protein